MKKTLVIMSLFLGFTACKTAPEPTFFLDTIKGKTVYDNSTDKTEPNRMGQFSADGKTLTLNGPAATAPVTVSYIERENDTRLIYKDNASGARYALTLESSNAKITFSTSLGVRIYELFY